LVNGSRFVSSTEWMLNWWWQPMLFTRIHASSCCNCEVTWCVWGAFLQGRRNMLIRSYYSNDILTMAKQNHQFCCKRLACLANDLGLFPTQQWTNNLLTTWNQDLLGPYWAYALHSFLNLSLNNETQIVGRHFNFFLQFQAFMKRSFKDSFQVSNTPTWS
jgi:hypothetical protein